MGFFKFCSNKKTFYQYKMSQKHPNGRVISNGTDDDKSKESCYWPQPGSQTHSSPNSTLSRLNSLDCWDYTIELECLQGPQDLQLAAELGKTLLERNKELESALKQHQNVIDDQTQEIEYLQKQTAALREVNDSRLRIYEQLEVGIQDLERANHRLIVENTNDKKHIKSLLHNIENLEARCEELSKTLDDVKQTLDIERRKNERLQQERNKHNEQLSNRLRNNPGFDPLLASESTNDEIPDHNESSENYSFAFEPYRGSRNANSTETADALADALDNSTASTEENEELIRLMTELEATKKAFLSEQQRVGELEEQLMAIIQENQTLQSRVVQASTNEEMKSVHEELSILEEVRQGTMCSRCLRSVDDRNPLEEGSSIAGTEDDEDRSLLDIMNPTDSGHVYRSAVTIKGAPKPGSLDLNGTSPNPYRELVEKYEALLEVQRHSITRNHHRQPQTTNLHDEFQTSGEYSSMNTKEDDCFMEKEKVSSVSLTNGNDNASSVGGRASSTGNAAPQARKNCRRTPTDFSEAETSSSGFSDETSNKATQTEERQGFFLCSIGDGEDCKFSIYDDASPIDSRFRNRPEYRELFKEIFAVLKKAAENKEEGENLPLLDDTHPVVSKVPPVTPANEELPDFGDDTQSIISSAVSEQSVAMSECITKTERKTAAKKHVVEKGQENKPPSVTALGPPNVVTVNGKQMMENGRVLTPLKREPLEYLSVSIGIKKKNRKKNRNFNIDRSDSPILPSPPRVFYSSGRKRREMRPFVSPSSSNNPQGPSTTNEWNGNSMVIYNRSIQSPSSSPNTSVKSRELDMNSVEFRPSTVSQDLHKLKKLDLSYAEVLRRADACKHHHRRK